MPDYSYSAIDDNGKIVKGRLVAMSEADLEARLLQDGLTLVRSRHIKTGLSDRLFIGRKVKPRLLIEFYHRLSQAMGLGLPLLSALDENAKTLPSKPLKKVVGEIRVGVEEGNTLYEAMSRFPKIFHKLDLGVIRMGEQSGVLPGCMKDLANFLEWKEDIRSVLKRAAMYPAFVIIVIGTVIGVWIGYVLPQMAKVLIDMGVELPGITQTILGISQFFQANWLWIILALMVLGVAFYGFLKTERGRILFHAGMLKIPFIGEIAGNIALARLSHNFATMYRAGMRLTDIFHILEDNVLGNRYLEERLGIAFDYIQSGQQIAEGFENAGGFPPLLLGGVRNGELTGTLDDSFKRLGDYYDGEVKKAVQTLISAIEPMTLLLLGGVFGLIVLSILLPLYDVVGSFGKAY